jgi:hypothetical protein
MARWNTKFDAALTSKVNGDLTIAHQYLARILENTGEYIQALGNSVRFQNVIRDGPDIASFLDASRKDLGLDFIYIVAQDGGIQAAALAQSSSARRINWPIISNALAGSASTAIDMFANDELADISKAMAERARIELVPTPNAVPTDRIEETRGMVVHSAAPVVLADGRRAALVGGILLNQNLVFIDTINDLVYREASLPEGSRGTATLFLDDVRISHECPAVRGTPCARHTRLRDRTLRRPRLWPDMARQRVRGQRLVHFCLRADHG